MFTKISQTKNTMEKVFVSKKKQKPGTQTSRERWFFFNLFVNHLLK